PDSLMACAMQPNSVMRWDGTNWSLLAGSGYTSRTYANFDPDGPGPLPTRMFVGGEIPSYPGVGWNYLGCWDGSGWLSLTRGLSDPPGRVVLFDPDGTGPLPARLVFGGDFYTAG